MITLCSPAEMAAWSRSARSRGESIAFVPTMGFLHEGHLALMREARGRCDQLVVSIFVNPLQFGEGEDLDRYPRDPEGDAAACREVGVDVLFTPERADLYPDGFQTRVQVGRLAGGLCGASRPGHFEGVATVVLKLFCLVGPQVAVFGQKDYQQLAVIRRMVHDLDVGVEVVGVPTVREQDGLAMSSRNAYLDEHQREQARVLVRALDLAELMVAEGERGAEEIVRAAADLIQGQPLATIDYVELVDADTLEVFCELERPAVLALAVHFGPTRLIDNRVLVL
jgi:pantoate--beta-alanine ligase